jgi:protein-S-isoprenylcysteine O-methyltransferase Ste14
MWLASSATRLMGGGSACFEAGRQAGDCWQQVVCGGLGLLTLMAVIMSTSAIPDRRSRAPLYRCGQVCCCCAVCFALAALLATLRCLVTSLVQLQALTGAALCRSCASTEVKLEW